MGDRGAEGSGGLGLKLLGRVPRGSLVVTDGNPAYDGALAGWARHEAVRAGDPSTANIGMVVLSRLLRKFQQAAAGRRHDHSSSSVTSRYLLDPHSLSATYLSLAVTSMSALLPSGNVPTTRVRRRISRFSRSMALFVRMRRQCRMGKRV